MGWRRCGGPALWRFLGGHAAVSEPEERTLQLAARTMRKDGMARGCQNGLEALRRVGSLEVFRGARGGLGTGRKDSTAAARTMRKDGMARGCQNGLEALRRVGSLEVFRGARGGLGTGRKDSTACSPHYEKGRHGQRLPEWAGGAAEGRVFGCF